MRGPSARAVCVGRSPRRRAREQPEHWTMERAMAKVARDYLASPGHLLLCRDRLTVRSGLFVFPR